MKTYNTEFKKLFILCLCLVCTTVSFAQNNKWKQYANVEEVGFSAKALDKVKTQLDSIDTASLLVVYKGNILFSYGDNTRKFMLHSIRKSIMNAMIGIEIEKGTYRDKDLGKLVDVFGDGSILLCDLNGHAIGQIGAILNTHQGNVFLIADACWLEDTYKENWLPNPIVKLLFGSWKGFLNSLQKIQNYYKNNPETLIIPCHCEATMRRIAEGN